MQENDAAGRQRQEDLVGDLLSGASADQSRASAARRTISPVLSPPDVATMILKALVEVRFDQ
jgi:hypothetical protein